MDCDIIWNVFGYYLEGFHFWFRRHNLVPCFIYEWHVCVMENPKCHKTHAQICVYVYMCTYTHSMSLRVSTIVYAHLLSVSHFGRLWDMNPQVQTLVKPIT